MVCGEGGECGADAWEEVEEVGVEEVAWAGGVFGDAEGVGEGVVAVEEDGGGGGGVGGGHGVLREMKGEGIVTERDLLRAARRAGG